MTLRMYATRKKWPLEQVAVEVDHKKVHHTDCEGCEEGQKGIDQFTRTVQMKGELTKEQRARLLEIASRCPVHHTLASASEVMTTEYTGGVGKEP